MSGLAAHTDFIEKSGYTAFQKAKSEAVNAWEDESLPVKTRKALINRALADIDLEVANLQRSKAHLKSLRTTLQ